MKAADIVTEKNGGFWEITFWVERIEGNAPGRKMTQTPPLLNKDGEQRGRR